MMRLPKLVVCTVTALSAASLAARANEGSPPNSPNLSTELDEEAQLALDPSIELSEIRDRLPKHLDAAPEAIAVQPEVLDIDEIATVASLEEQAELAPEEAIALPHSSEISPLAQTPDEEETENLQPLAEIATTAEALQPDKETGDFGIQSPTATLNDAIASASDCAATTGEIQLAQGTCPRPRPYRAIATPDPYEFESSPAMSIYIPVGYGAEKNTVFLTGNYQASVRNDPGSVGNGGIGIGLGDAKNAVGAELSYAFANNPTAGEGGFNAKLHRRIDNDLSVAVGWNGFLNIGRHDWEHSLYGVATKVFRTRDSLDEPFSRVSVTAGVGSNQFRSNGARRVGDNNANVFGNVAVRVLRPVSLIAEWTGQDLGVGLSIAPIRNFPLVITPAVRDLAGNEFRTRFVLTGGMAVQF